MDEERRQFLSEALQNLTTDHVKRLQQLMDTLAKPEDGPNDQSEVEEKEDALEELIGGWNFTWNATVKASEGSKRPYTRLHQSYTTTSVACCSVGAVC